ncbi:hypothetical protein JCM14076_06470 [Methylosoma difficile]
MKKTGEIVKIWVRVTAGRHSIYAAGITINKQWQEVDVDRTTRAALKAHGLIEVVNENPNPVSEELLQPEEAGRNTPSTSETAEQADGGVIENPSGEAGETTAEEEPAQAETEAVETAAEEPTAQAETEAVEAVAEEAKPATKPASKKKPKPDSAG